jgi:ribosomal protein S18 acetylase RimI-like enzyme
MIEPARPEDAPAIQGIARSAGVFSPNELASVSEMLDAFFNPTPDDDFLFIVSCDGSRGVVGFACYGPIPFTDRVWDLYWICVERSRQRNGVGKELIRGISEHLRARAARAIYLETSESDAYGAARAFYEREGFECIARLPDFYAGGEGKKIYRKEFR